MDRVEGPARTKRLALRAIQVAAALPGGGVEEEADETLFWPERIVEARLRSRKRLEPLPDEADQAPRIAVAARKAARAKPPPG